MCKVCRDGEPSLHEVVTHLKLMSAHLKREVEPETKQADAVIDKLDRLCSYVSIGQEHNILKEDFAEDVAQLVTCMRQNASCSERCG